MAWKKEYAETRRSKAAADPEYRAKRNAQSTNNKEARAQYMDAYYKKNPEKFKRTPEQRAKYNEIRRQKYKESAEFRAEAKSAAKAWQDGNPLKRKSQRLKQYGLTLQEFNALMESQSGACAICGHSDTSTPNFFPVVDHCHSSGKVRGLLCMACNMGLGKFKDDPARLLSAVSYLKSHG